MRATYAFLQNSYRNDELFHQIRLSCIDPFVGLTKASHLDLSSLPLWRIQQNTLALGRQILSEKYAGIERLDIQGILSALQIIGNLPVFLAKFLQINLTYSGSQCK